MYWIRRYVGASALSLALYTMALLVCSGVHVHALDLADVQHAKFQQAYATRSLSQGSDIVWFAEATETYAEAVTVRSMVQIHTTGDVKALYLASLAGVRDRVEGLIDIVWVPRASTWFGTTWTVELHVRSAAEPVVLELATVNPTRTHRYETLLSYDAQTGVVAYSIRNLTNGSVVAKGTYQADAVTDELVLRAGVVVRDSVSSFEAAQEIVATESLGATSRFLPVGVEWGIGTDTETGTFLPATRFEATDTVVVRLDNVPSDAGHGRLVLSAENDHGFLQTIDITDAKVEVDAASLPAGPVRFRVTYEDASGEPMLSEVREVVIGHVVLTLSDSVVDREQGRVVGAATLISEGPIHDLGVALTATLHRMTWDPVRRQYGESFYSTTQVAEERIALAEGGSVAIEFAVPLPDDPGLWLMELSASNDQGVGLELHGERGRLFSTYPVADIRHGEDFTLIVLPDTQEYPKSHPHILTRQAEWIAAYARDLSIGAVLHVGDIVDWNEPIQWRNAKRSMGVLDGAVPYVLAVGNHDVRVSRSGGSDVLDRNGSLINEYFSVENGLRNSGLAGTFEPGRLENTYSLFEFGGSRYMVVSLEFGPRDSVLDWANQVVAQHPDHKVIVVTHAFTAPDGGWVTPERFPNASPEGSRFLPNADPSVNSAASIWAKFLSRHPNIFLVLSGHIDTKAMAHQVTKGQHGNPVFQVVTDYQFDPNGGNGWLAMLRFTADGKIIVRAFSPYLGAHRYDIDDRGFGHNFIIDLESGTFLPYPSEMCAYCGP